jgi:hypothetical protein
VSFLARIVLLFTAASSGCGTLFPAGAAVTRIPAGLYPAGSHVVYQPTLSNHQMDCAWGFFCEGNIPLFHYFTQDQLHRIGGWAQSASARPHGAMMAFQLFASRYDPQVSDDGTPWSERAFQDLATITHDHGYRLLSSLPAVMSDTASGGVLAESKHSGAAILVVLACWSGSVEIEAIALADRRSPAAARTALTDLTRQVTGALGRTSASVSQQAEGAGAYFALSPASFPLGSRVIRAGVETNQQLLGDEATHFELPPEAMGCLTGYYMDAVEGDPATEPHPYTSYLVSLFGSVEQAQTAFDLRWNTWFSATYFTTPPPAPIPLGDRGAEALFHTFDPTQPPLSELLFRHGAILVEVFQGARVPPPASSRRSMASRRRSITSPRPTPPACGPVEPEE